jgi:hypothetical protein
MTAQVIDITDRIRRRRLAEEWAKLLLAMTTGTPNVLGDDSRQPPPRAA